MNYLEKINAAKEWLENKTNCKPTIGMILGSGLGTMADQIKNPDKFPYEDIPSFPASTVKGHQGQLVFGELEGKQVVAMQGRVHFYEGYSMQEITFPVRVMKTLGIQNLIVTSACGGLSPKLYAGALMFVTDHLNLMGSNPLMGDNFDELGPRFPDTSEAYSSELIALGQKAAKSLDIETFTGVNAAISGPYYLSNAELRMVKKVGADSIGMSMIPEMIVAAHSGLKALGISCITDLADPDQEIEPLTHEKVVEVANRTRPKFIKLVSKIVETI